MENIGPEFVLIVLVFAIAAGAVCGLYEARHWIARQAGRLARAIADLWVAFWDRHVTVSWAELMSIYADREPAPATPEPVPASAGTPDTDAVEPAPEPPAQQPKAGRSIVITPHLSDVDLIAVLASQQTSEGKPRFTSNQLAALIGGNRAERLRQISEARGEPVALFRHEDGSVGPATRPVTSGSATA